MKIQHLNTYNGFVTITYEKDKAILEVTYPDEDINYKESLPSFFTVLTMKADNFLDRYYPLYSDEWGKSIDFVISESDGFYTATIQVSFGKIIESFELGSLPSLHFSPLMSWEEFFSASVAYKNMA